MSLAEVLALQLLVMVLSAIAMGWSRYLATVVGIVSLFVPALLPDGTHGFVIAVTAIFAALPLLKTKWHWHDDKLPLIRRLHQWTTPFDVAQVRRERTPLGPRVVRGVLFGALLMGAWQGVDRLVDGRAVMSLPPWGLAAVCVLGASMVYATLEVAEASVGLGYGLAGFAIPAIQRDPILSRSVSEFWVRRWNRPVSEFLSRCFFRPAVKRGSPRTGLVMAFVVSALVHVYLVLLCAPAWKVFAMGLFFVLQAPVVFAERRLKLHRRPRWMQHGWTVAVLLITCPLFVIPILEPFGFP